MFRAKLGQIAKDPKKVNTQRGGAGVFSADWIRGRSSCVARNCKRPLRRNQCKEEEGDFIW